jgi:hypothetical protein
MQTRRAALVGIGLALATGLLAAPAAAADSTDNIPGVELPTGVVSGQLGGPIYDVVYRITVAPGYVVVVSLTGSTGTDFDLYVFDSTATTVLSNVGLIAKSTGPTSTESLSVASRSGGTYYIDLNGASNVEGSYRLVVQTVADQTPPVVSMGLGNGHGFTNQLTVAVNVSAIDDLSGVVDMAFSEDGSAYAGWLPYQGSTTWTFAPGDGRRTLWVKVRNGAGLVSAPASAAVTIDTVQPSATALVPAPGSTVNGLRPEFTVTFDEPIDPATWLAFGLIVQAASGDLVPGDYTYDATSRTGTFVPSHALQPGATYVVTIGAVKDLAGNQIAPRGSWTVTPIISTGLSVHANPAVVKLGGTSTLDVLMSGGPASATVSVEARPNSSVTFAPLTVMTLHAAPAQLPIAPDRNTVYRLTYPGAPGIAAAQAEVRVLVRIAVGMVGVNSSVVARARVGHAVALTAQVKPAIAGVPLAFRLYRYDTNRRVWVYVSSRTRATDAHGLASLTWTPSSRGSYSWRVSAGATPDFANNTSAAYRWSVGS